jgi:fermentation-respiration switch protein FrsA (DUF1100 family)
MRRNVEFLARDLTLRGWLFTPDSGQGPFPTVVATHGWACVKEQGLDVLGEKLAEAGVAALIYDHRNLGESDGVPRGHIDPWAQIHDYRHAISYAQTLDEVDPDRMGIWGTSYSAGHCVAVAAIDHRVKAAAVLVPMLAGLANTQRLMATMADWDNTMAFLDGERARWARGEEPTTIAITAPDASTPHAFPGPQIYKFFSAWGDKAPNWRNECTVMSLDMTMEYDPTAYLDKLGTTPMQFIVAENDLTCPPDLALAGYARIAGPKELIMIPGDHYTSYLENMPYAAIAATEFLHRQLTRTIPAVG